MTIRSPGNPAQTPKLQVVASRAGINTGSIWGNYINGRTDTFMECRRQCFIGPYAVSQLRIGSSGFYMSNAALGEIAFPNDLLWNVAIEDTANSKRWGCFANGQSDIVIQGGTPLILTDALGIQVAAGGSIYVVQRHTVQSPNHLIPTNTRGDSANDQFGYVGTFAALDMYSGSGTLSIPGTGNCAAVAGTFPNLILGIPATPHPAVCILGDSIPDGTGETATTTNGASGFIARGLELALASNTICVPYTHQTTGGDLLSVNTSANSLRKRAAWQYHTHIIDNLGTNDIHASVSLATLQAQQLALWTAMKQTVGPYGKPLNVTKVTIMPRTTSTDSWATAANQTAQTAQGVGGIRDQFNAWLATQVGQGLLDTLVDVNPTIEDQANLSKWITTGAANYPTTDGTHPSTALHILASAPIKTWAQSLSV